MQGQCPPRWTITWPQQLNLSAPLVSTFVKLGYNVKGGVGTDQTRKVVSGLWANPPHLTIWPSLIAALRDSGGWQTVGGPALWPVICPQQHPWKKKVASGDLDEGGRRASWKRLLGKEAQASEPWTVLGPDLHWGVIVGTPECVCGVNHFRARHLANWFSLWAHLGSPLSCLALRGGGSPRSWWSLESQWCWG